MIPKLQIERGLSDFKRWNHHQGKKTPIKKSEKSYGKFLDEQKTFVTFVGWVPREFFDM